MYTKRTLTTAVCILGALMASGMRMAHGQAPAATLNDSLHSPEVAPDGHVTFRLYAPDAHQVRLHAEGLEATPDITPQELQKVGSGQAMTHGANGVWTIDFGPIQPGVYRYTFSVDGVQTTDPRNPNSSETLNSVRSVYEVPGATFIEYRPDVPHGAIASVWYRSKATGGLRRMHVYTPPGYGIDHGRYPVLYLLHGGGDTDDSWPTVVALEQSSTTSSRNIRPRR